MWTIKSTSKENIRVITTKLQRQTPEGLRDMTIDNGLYREQVASGIYQCELNLFMINISKVEWDKKH